MPPPPWRLEACTERPAGLTRTCPDCQVASLDDACWICGRDVNDRDLKGTVRIANPAGPLPAAVGVALIL